MLQYIACVAIMIAGALGIAVVTIYEYSNPVAAHVRPKFPSHIELAIGATVILAFAAAGWMVGGH